MATAKRVESRSWASLLIAGLALAPLACGSDNSSGGSGGNAGAGANGGSAGTSNGGSAGQGGSAGAADCYENPQTHEEIINACTDAQKIAKDPELPLLNSDGSLPPLP